MSGWQTFSTLIFFFLLNAVRELQSKGFAGQAGVLLEKAGGRGQHLHQQGVDVVLQVGLLPGLMFDAVLEADDGLDQVLQQEVCFVTQEETIKLAFLTHTQCDQMAKVIFNIGPFTK